MFFADKILQAFKSHLVLNLLLLSDLQKPLNRLSRVTFFKIYNVLFTFFPTSPFGLNVSVFTEKTSQMILLFCLQLSHGEKEKVERFRSLSVEGKSRPRTILILANHTRENGSFQSLRSLRAGSHLGERTRAAKNELKKEAICQRGVW